MKNIEFPVFKTKTEKVTKRFDLISPQDRKEYFEAKAGPEIEKIRQYLKENSFVAYLMGKKNAGKGTYAKMFSEIIGPDSISHFSVGDMIREVDKELADENKKLELVKYLKRNYRGWVPFNKIMDFLENRSTRNLLPNELILTLLKREIAKQDKRAIFLDGFPRSLDQVSFSLFFRELIGYRDDPDIFILIDVSENVIDERIKYRRICPKCKTSRNLKLLPTKKIGYEESKDEFYLLCDSGECNNVKMIQKEGDELGIETIRERLITDEEIIEKAFSLYGIPKILLRNSVPKAQALESFDSYEITPEYVYYWDEDNKKVNVEEKPWEVIDDSGENSYSLLPPPVIISMIKQMSDIVSQFD